MIWAPFGRPEGPPYQRRRMSDASDLRDSQPFTIGMIFTEPALA